MHIGVQTHPMASSSITEGYRYVHPGIWAHGMYMGPQTIASNPGASLGFQGNMTDVLCAVMETPCVKMLVAKAAKHCEVCIHCW